jgi:hypothetical protein
MVNDIFSIHGAVETITTDMGTQFMSEVFQSMSKLLGIQHIHTTAYNPAANGTCERVNRDLKATLTIYTNRYGNDWTRYLPLITHAHNCRVHKTTGFSPYHLVFGREPVLFSDLGLKIYLNKENFDMPNFVRDLQKRLEVAWEEATTSIERSQQNQKAHYDRNQHARQHNFNLNDLVLFYREVPPSEERTKFATHWQGPYRVSYVKPPNITLLDINNRPFMTHLNKVKKYYPEEPLAMRLNDEPSLQNMNNPNIEPFISESEIEKENDSEESNQNVPNQIEEAQTTLPLIKNQAKISEMPISNQRYNLRPIRNRVKL